MDKIVLSKDESFFLEVHTVIILRKQWFAKIPQKCKNALTYIWFDSSISTFMT